MTTKQLLSSNNYIQYPKFLGYYIGVNEAVLLSALCDKDSWCENYCRDYEGKFYFLKSEIELETGLSESQQRTALKSLVDLKIISTSRHGCPSRVYYEIDVEILESVLTVAYNDYSQRKSQQSQNMTTSDNKNITTSGIENRISSIDNNKDIKINNKAPAEPALSSIKSRRRDMISRSINTLDDSLESGKDITEFEASKKMKPAERFKKNSLAMIESLPYDDETKKLLVDYFNFASTSKNVRRIKDIDLWTSKLDDLANLVNEGYNSADIVRQSLEKKKYVFYPLESAHNNIQYNNQSNKFETGNVIPTQMTHEEILAEKQRLLDAGAKVY